MTRYSRSVIPGRAPIGEPSSGDDLDRMIFGKAQAAETAAEPTIRKPARPELDDDDPPERLFTERAPRDRRASAGRRKKDDFPPSAGWWRPLFQRATASAVR